MITALTIIVYAIGMACGVWQQFSEWQRLGRMARDLREKKS